MADIINYHVRHSVNIGDFVSSPLSYFEIPGRQSELRDIDELLQPSLGASDRIIGGGGLLFPRFLKNLQQVRQQNPSGRVILWGVGQQSYYDPSQSWRKFDYAPYLDGVDLVGIRDYDVGLPWVPCASCMHPEFDRPRSPKHEVVVFSHKKFRLNIKGLPTFTNKQVDFRAVLDFLGSGDTILTSSFHGAYWGTLLGRRVLAFPFSSKFFGLKHRPGIYPIERWRPKHYKISVLGKTLYQRFSKTWFQCPTENWQDYLEDCPRYPESLAECRERNRQFYEQVVELINASS
ncbi:hypothetical protein E1H12_18755 [Geitlerinema sp. P-1104]|uniref:hypothetical protein n=1 Tax=Geitlerinema sp. P-1104 TaxID=2546230 RepID=UPI0014774ECB|nr:hypothetical protein [Geitlerinema sp. P-1104]NMG60499.1 hypothetical protein [Geitlerinema sp. P-1104]